MSLKNTEASLSKSQAECQELLDTNKSLTLQLEASNEANVKNMNMAQEANESLLELRNEHNAKTAKLEEANEARESLISDIQVLEDEKQNLLIELQRARESSLSVEEASRQGKLQIHFLLIRSIGGHVYTWCSSVRPSVRLEIKTTL